MSHSPYSILYSLIPRSHENEHLNAYETEEENGKISRQICGENIEGKMKTARQWGRAIVTRWLT